MCDVGAWVAAQSPDLKNPRVIMRFQANKMEIAKMVKKIILMEATGTEMVDNIDKLLFCINTWKFTAPNVCARIQQYRVNML